MNPLGSRAGDAARLRAAIGIVLAVVLGIGAVTASASAVAVADSSSDIPGVPLAPGVVVGQLGGNIYDVVYSLVLPPGTVILASLTGTPGTDFDLYLFDGSATTVVTNQGVVARSTGPTSTESISYATSIGGRYYIDLNSATAAVGTYTLVVQVIPDRPAVAVLALGAGESLTNNPTVPVSLSASGSLSGPAEMAFSADGTTWGSWQPYQASTTWTFPSGDGTKTLWAKVQNVAGAISAPVSASIVLDTRQPRVMSVDPAITEDLVGSRPKITVTFDKPIDPASWTQIGLVVQTADGALVPGTFTVVAPNVGSYQPSVDLATGSAYVMTVGPVRDLAGNAVVPIGSWVATDRQAPDITVQAAPRVVDRGATALLAGRLAAPSGVTSLELEATPVGALQTVSLGSVAVGADGSFSASVKPSSTTSYRFDVPAVGSFGAGSVSAVVFVRRTVRLNWSSSTLHYGRVGSRVSIVESASPANSGLGVAFQLQRWSPLSRSWMLVGTTNRRTDTTGRASVGWTPSGSGVYRWRATAASTPDYSTGSSPWVSWSINS